MAQIKGPKDIRFVHCCFSSNRPFEPETYTSQLLHSSFLAWGYWGHQFRVATFQFSTSSPGRLRSLWRNSASSYWIAWPNKMAPTPNIIFIHIFYESDEQLHLSLPNFLRPYFYIKLIQIASNCLDLIWGEGWNPLVVWNSIRLHRAPNHPFR